MFIDLFLRGCTGFSFFRSEGHVQSQSTDKSATDANLYPSSVSSRDEKDILETFATVFIHLDAAAFQEIFDTCLPTFHEQIVQNTLLLQIPQFFLTNDGTSPIFAGLLLQFLTDKLPELGSSDHVQNSVLLRLFKMCFMAVTMFPDLNEPILQPHLANIIIQSMKLSAVARNPINYYMLMRMLFRSIGGGRFELLYKEVLPLLQVLLECLNTLLQAARRPSEKELFVELCLTVPVRLSVLLPYLNYLMKPLVLALSAGPDLVTQGLRTLELCIDNLTQEFLDPIVQPVLSDLMKALWSHLRPLPHNHHHSHSALRILGKLGGRNRKFLDQTKAMSPETSVGPYTPAFAISFHGSENENLFHWTQFVGSAVKILIDTRSDVFYKRHALTVVQATLRSFFCSNPNHGPISASRLRAMAQWLASGHDGDEKMVLTKSETNRRVRCPRQLQLDEQLFCQVVSGLFAASRHDALRDDCQRLLLSVTQSLTVSYLSDWTADLIEKRSAFVIEDGTQSMHLRSSLLLDVLVDALASEEDAVCSLAERCVLRMHKTCLSVLGSKVNLYQLPIFGALLGKCCHACFEDQWYRKFAGTLGISILIEKVELESKWLQKHQSELVRALLYVIKDMPVEIPTTCVTDAIRLLNLVIARSHEDADVSKLANSPLIAILVSELANPNGQVRETVQSLFSTISTLTHCSIQDLLEPVKDRLLIPIFTKPLRALPFAMQIGHIDAVSFCLSLTPVFLDFNDELLRLLHEALALADADDDHLVSVNRTSQYKSASSLVNLRIVCIKLLTIAVAAPEFSTPQQAQSRSRIISVFFKSLYSKSSDVVEVANTGLKQVLTQNHKLPKDLLQAGLRPILMNLSDHKRLTVPGLEGLARLLELLTNYFKVEIGKKLLDHLKAWADPATLQAIAGKPLRQQQCIKVIAAILNIFHLLPPSAHMFLDELVKAVLGLEEQLRRVLTSPLRQPMLLFVNKYAAETWEYLKARLSNSKITTLLLQIAAQEGSNVFRQTLLHDLDAVLTENLASEGESVNSDTALIEIASIVSGQDAKANITPAMLESLRSILQRSLKLEQQKLGNGSHIRHCNLVISIHLQYFTNNPEDVTSLLALCRAQAASIICDSVIFDEYLSNVVLSTGTDDKRSIFKAALDVFPDEKETESFKTALFRRILIPLLLAERLENSATTQFVDTGVVEHIHSSVWKVALTDFDEGRVCSTDVLRIELLQFSTIMLRGYSDLLSDIRKDLIKFAWNYIKLDDLTTKNAAYVFISYFVAAYEIPAKMTAQIFFALLKTAQPEVRGLVKQSLDAMAPVLPLRIPQSADVRSPSWIKYSRKVLAEEPNAMQLIPVYQFICRQPKLFSTCREHFLPPILSALPKMAFSQNTNSESKVVAVELSETVAEWLREGQLQESQSGSYGFAACRISDDQFDNLLRALTRLACTALDSYKKGLVARVLLVIKSLLLIHPKPFDALPMDVLELYLSEVDEKQITVSINAIEVFILFLSNQTADTLGKHAEKLLLWLERLIRSDQSTVQSAGIPAVRLIMAAILTESAEDDQSNELLKSHKARILTALQECLQMSPQLPNIVTLIELFTEYAEDSIDSLVPSMLRIFNTLIKDHIQSRAVNQSLGAPAVTVEPSSGVISSNELETSSETLVSLIQLMARRVATLGDQRRFFLAAIAQLIEKSPSPKLCRRILDTVTTFVTQKKETFPTIKEKVSLLLKMTAFEGRGDEDLTKAYLQLICSIYRDPTIARTELTVRLEQAFLMGTRAIDPNVRMEFMSIFNSSMSRSIYTRLNYIFGVQNWESLSNHFWISQANHLLLGSIAAEEAPSLHSPPFQFREGFDSPMTANAIFERDEALEDLMKDNLGFSTCPISPNVDVLINAIAQLQHLDSSCGESLWVELISCAWSVLQKKERQEIAKASTIQLSKECHLRQVDKRPNVIQSLMKGLAMCRPLIALPPHLVKYLGKTFNAWYIALDLLERSAAQLRVADPFSGLYDSSLDALTEMYASLAEEDMFYGLWRSRCRYLETNAAISYEQNGMWDKSQQLYENAQVKARTGVLPFSESEYTLWEDHWILCAQKLQQWDVLTDLAKQEGYSDLLLECAWRISDWTTDREPLEASIKSLMDVPTPRRYTFEAFMALQKTQAKLDTMQDFHKICDEGMQLSLRKWHQLPEAVSAAHIPLLQSFQQYVELQEASQVYVSLANTHAQNLEAKSHELKHILQTWRERLPNFYDDINGWSDLVAWRQLVFSSINRVYLPLVSALQQPAAPNANSSATSFAYRGYHETAWIINRFAHVARKHQLPDVCINQLTKIYTLPNIEIQEAFLKLREQAKCHYQNTAELGMGLEVISNTNLMYFGTQQKAEFFTLKGMFLAKLKLNEEANQAFATAIQIDLTLPKAWAEWGQYSDRLYQEDPAELTKAGNAVSCYLQAAGLYKNGRARNMLSRVLWLLSLDDAEGCIASAFDSYKGEVPTWYWVTFIPQLLTSLSHKEARHARQVLIRIAKTFPQSLHFQLRTTKEDYAVIKKQALAAAQNATVSAKSTTAVASTESKEAGVPASEPETKVDSAGKSNSTVPNTGQDETSTAHSPQVGQAAQTRQPWEHVDEIMAILKTAYPLLALSMESMVDQIQQKFKCQADEDAYRLIVALLNDGVQYIGRLVTVTSATKLPPATQANVMRFAESVLPKNIKAAFEREFVLEKPNLQDYVTKLRKWRDKFEMILDQRDQIQQLEQVSPYLSEFQYQKFDEVEVPGQYLQHRDHNSDFIRIDRFMSTLDVVRGHGICYRRITMRGHDGSLHQFAIQYPAARHCRREERITQLFRILSGVLARRKESRRRGLHFHLPAAIPLAPHIRIVQDDSTYISLQAIYEDYCARTGLHKDDPLRLANEKIQQATDVQNSKQNLINLKVEILNTIQRDLVPNDIVLNFFKESFSTFEGFWCFRKHFSQQYASLTFMTYIMNINNRFPHKLFISRKTGQVWGTEILPGMAPNNPVFHNGEAVPFRFTPTIQTFMGPTSTEGVFSCAVMSVARCLTEPEHELDQHLSVFVRDELITWFTQQHRPVTQETQLPEKVASNVAQIVRRASSLAQVAQGNLPAYQTIIDLISQAVNPKNLAQMDQLWSVRMISEAIN